MANADLKQAEENQRKYGNEDDDVIARAYREGQVVGDVWCAKNVERYLRRFISNSAKAHNYMDLLKAKDYLERMIAANESLKSTSKEIIETVIV